MSAQFDHVVVGVRSLSEGIAHFQRLTGAAAVPGGVHPGRGTENAVVTLGGGEYLEIIAPQAEARLSEADSRLRGLDRLTIVAWAVAVDNADEAMAVLNQSRFETTLPQHGSRVTPSGTRLEWDVFTLSDEKIAGAPFFIEWSATTAHPSTTASGGCARERFKVQTPASVRLSAALEALGVHGVIVTHGAYAIEAAITCGLRRALLMSQ